MPAPASNQELFGLIVKSGLMDEPRLKEYLRALAATPEGVPGDPVSLAGRMVRDGLLSGFQSENLLQGRWKRFFIGKYVLLERLGVGGMGQVFLCEHKLMKRKVAVKVLPAAKAKDAASLQRFYREARAVAAMDHPNLVRAYDIDQDGGLHFLVMEYVDGANLHDIVRLSGPLPPVRASHYVYGASVGLQHAHEMGLIHRDIKPANILVDRNGVVKILDMGLARFFHPDADDNLTQKFEENVLGTADYLAPEQAVDSSAVDIRADIYGLGCTFYFLLTGQPPFPDSGVAMKLLAHQSKPPRPITAFRSDVPAPLIAVVDKMMAKDPADRQQTPAEVVADLTPWVRTPIAPPAEHELPRLSVAAGGNGRDQPRSNAPTTIGGDLNRQPTVVSPAALGPPIPVPPDAASATPRPNSAAQNVWETLTSGDTTPPAEQDTGRTRGGRKAAADRPPDDDNPPSGRSRPGKRSAEKSRRALLLAASIAGGLVLLGVAAVVVLVVVNPFAETKIGPTRPARVRPPHTWYISASGDGPNPATSRKSLDEVTAELRPGDRIVILDDTFESGPIRLKSVTLEAGNPARSVTWKYTPSTRSVPRAALEISESDHVTVRGLDLDVGGQLDVGVLVSGAGSIEFDRVTVRNAKKFGFQLLNAAADSRRKLTLDRCRVVGGPTLDAAVHLSGVDRTGTSGVEITDSRFEGAGVGAVLRAEGVVSGCEFRNNRAYNFAVGVSVPEAGDPFELTVERNTFHTLTTAGIQVDQSLGENRTLTVARNFFYATAEVDKIDGDSKRVIATDNGRDAESTKRKLNVLVANGVRIPKPEPDATADQFLKPNMKITVGASKVVAGAE